MNGVSRIHGSVASRMEGALWPQIPEDENPIDYITNGVHVPTFLSREWVSLFDLRFDDWQSEMLNREFWNRIEDIPDYQYWSVHKAIKQQMLGELCQRVRLQHERNGSSHAHTVQVLQAIAEPDSDIHALLVDRVVSVTPLSLDLTSRVAFEKLGALLR